MKKGLHNAAVVTATVDLLYAAAVMIFWLCNGLSDMADMSVILVLSLPIHIVFVVVSMLFLIGICRAKGNVLMVVYWSVLIAELMATVLIGGMEVLGFCGTLALCAAVILVVTLLRKKLNFKWMCVIISLAAVIMSAVELWFIVVYAPLGLGMLITVFYPWMPAAPLLPTIATILMTAAQKAE